MQLHHWNWKKVILIHREKGSALTPAAIKIYDFSRNISFHFAASINNDALLDPKSALGISLLLSTTGLNIQ